MKIDKIILGKRILIVDDEKDVLDTLVELLANCKIDIASSYDQAVEMMDKNSYDLAILDIMGVNGYKLLERARKRPPDPRRASSGGSRSRRGPFKFS